MKEQLAKVIASRLIDGDVVGIGSGSTTEAALHAIAARMQREHIRVRGVATSHRSAALAEEAGIDVLRPGSAVPIRWAFDGADEVDENLNLLKGRGAAMLHEKIVAASAGHFVVIVTEEKLVSHLGEKFPVPIEVIPAAEALVRKNLEEAFATAVTVRKAEKKYGPLITEEGNIVLDVVLQDYSKEVATRIAALPGVVETGLFFGLTDEVLVAKTDGIWSYTVGESGQEAEKLT